MICRLIVGAVFWAISISLPAGAEEYRVVTSRLAISATPKMFVAITPGLTVVSGASQFRFRTGPLSVAAVSDSLVVKTPPLQVSANVDEFATRTPVLTAVAQSALFQSRAPKLRVAARQSVFRARMAALSVTVPDTGQDASDDNFICKDLLQCHLPADILRVEKTLRSDRDALETSAAFCAAVAAQLGECTDDPPRSGDAPTAPSLTAPAPKPPASPPDVPAVLNFNRCPPFERYMIELENRKTAGEDTTAAGEQVMLLMMSAQNHLLSGRSDLWCEELTAGLPE